MAIQTDLINLLAAMGESVEITIDPIRREAYQKIVKSETVRQSVRLLKRFIPLQGKTGIDQKVERLHKQVVALTESSEFNKQNPYHPYVMQMLDELNYYIEKMDDDDSEMGINPQYLGKLPEIMTSQQLLSLDFETIGLQGKWRELIGDPSVGFSMMVFGQPKSGKSTRNNSIRSCGFTNQYFNWFNFIKSSRSNFGNFICYKTQFESNIR